MQDFKNVFAPGEQTDPITELNKQAQSLLSKVSPLMKFQFDMQQLQNQLSEKQNPGIGNAISQMSAGTMTEQDVYVRTARDLAGVGNAASDYAEKLKILQALYASGNVSASEFDAAQIKLASDFQNTQTTMLAGINQFFLQYQKQAADTATQVKGALTDAFNAATDALTQFVNTGKININKLAESIETGLLKSAMGSVTADAGSLMGLGAKTQGSGGLFGGSPLFGLLGGSSSPASAPGTVESFLSGQTPNGQGLPVFVTNAGGLGASSAVPVNPVGAAVNAGAGGLSPQTNQPSVLQNITGAVTSGLQWAGNQVESMFSGMGSGISSLLGFASGGSFEVGTHNALATINGADNRLVAFRAQDGERVTVTPRGQSPGGSQIVQHFNISTPDANSFGRSQTQITAAGLMSAQRMAKRNGYR